MDGKLYISCGVPGSGKTTFLKSIVKKDEAIISRDDIRFALLKDDEEYFSHEKEVFNQFVNIITEHINSGHNVYADATHLTKASRDKLLYALTRTGCHPSAIEAIYFDTSVETCLKRNENRKDTKFYVPRGVIRRMHEQAEYPFEFSKVWIVDEKGEVHKTEK